MPLLHYLQDFVSETLMWAWLAVFALGTLIERLWPAEKGQPLADLSLNIGYSLVLNWMLFTATPLLVALEALILNRVGLGLVALPGEGWALAASAAVYIVFMDFLEYLFHRAQHAWPILWAMHSFHHSDPSVNVTTTQRNFWLEGPIKLLASIRSPRCSSPCRRRCWRSMPWPAGCASSRI
jgi:sterol desaturase/sphingolipid hydroxylase (fatty acid hydroxylase superfamily)